jgi:hypothetical protein
MEALTDITTVYYVHELTDARLPGDVDSVDANATRALPDTIWSKARARTVARSSVEGCT